MSKRLALILCILSMFVLPAAFAEQPPAAPASGPAAATPTADAFLASLGSLTGSPFDSARPACNDTFCSQQKDEACAAQCAPGPHTLICKENTCLTLCKCI
ncbi:MAG TPA: hypothetical protein VOA87_14295 [Thermoanaerobaculia bacterium]|nr:hypothetical protein [Thermoanaerobaculia bacterium]